MKSTRIAPILVISAIAAISQTQSYVVQEVSTGGYANAISGRIVGGSYNNRAVLWDEAGPFDMHPVGFTFSAVNGRSGDMSVGFAGTSSLAQDPILWRGTSASTLLVPFSYVVGRAVATDGAQVVGYAAETTPEGLIGTSHALLWNANTGASVDLGKKNSLYGVGGGVQVGVKPNSKGTTATLWRGTANSAVDLHVRGNDISVACDTNGAVQVGYVGIDVRVRNEARPRDIRFYSAGYWTGTAASFNYLPSAYRHSFALGIKGDTIVGYGNTSDAIGTPKDSHAVAWIGESHDYVDLHAMLPADMRTSRATCVDELGNIVGYGVTTSGLVKSFVWVRQ